MSLTKFRKRPARVEPELEQRIWALIHARGVIALNLDYATAQKVKDLAIQIAGINGLAIVTDDDAVRLIVQKLELTK
jgi:hypothetical protein